MMTITKKNVVSVSAGFCVMLATAIAAYAIPIPFLREVLNDHLFAVVVWSCVTILGGNVAQFVARKL